MTDTQTGRLRRRLCGDQGVTLAELVIASAVTAVLGLMVMMSLSLAQRITIVMDRRIQTQQIQRDALDSVLRDLQDARPTALCVDPPPGQGVDPVTGGAIAAPPISDPAMCRRVEENWGYLYGTQQVAGGAILVAETKRVCYYTNPTGTAAVAVAPQRECLQIDSAGAMTAQRWMPNTGVGFLGAAAVDAYPAYTATPAATRRIGTVQAGYDVFAYYGFDGAKLAAPVTGTALHDIATVEITLRQTLAEAAGANSNNLVVYAAIRSNRYNREATWKQDQTPIVDDGLGSSPGAPLVLAADGGDGYAAVMWSPPADTGGSAISDYQITVYDATGSSQPAGVTGSYTRVVSDLFTSQLTASTGKWGWWRLNDTTGSTVADSSGNNRPLTLQAGAVAASANGVALSKAVTFGSASDGYAGSSTASVGTRLNVTIECWVYLSGPLNGPCVRVGGGQTGFSIGLGSTTYTTAGRNVIAHFPGVRWINTGQSLADGWHHLALVIKSPEVAGNPVVPTVYVDGRSVGVYTGTNPSIPTAGVYIGRNIGDEGGGITSLDTAIDEVVIHTRALTAGELAKRAAFRTGASFDGLTNGAGYRFDVAAINSRGRGPASLLSPAVVPGSSYRTTVLQDSPIVYWKLDETAGTTAADISGSGYSAIYQGAVTRGTASPVSNTITPSAAVSMAGDGARVESVATTPLNFTGQQGFSVELWARRETATGQMVFASTTSNATNKNRGYEVGVYADGRPYMSLIHDWAANNQITAAWGTNVIATSTAGSPRWYHLVYTYDGSGTHAGMRVFVDSVELTAKTEMLGQAGGLNGTISTTNPLVLGRRSQTTEFALNGALDEVAVYNYVLDPQRVLAHYNARNS